MNLRLHHHKTVAGAALPFCHQPEDYEYTWSSRDYPFYKMLRSKDYFSVYRDDEEVARAEATRNAENGGEYVEYTLPDLVVKIDFFEVKNSLKGQGIGREMAALLVDFYPGRWFMAVAASDEGKEFWPSIGWIELHNLDAPTHPTDWFAFHESLAH